MNKIFEKNILYKRFYSFLFDLLLSVSSSLISYQLSWKNLISIDDIFILIGVNHFVFTTLFYLFSKSQTIGQKIMRISLVTINENKVGFGKIFLRNILFCLIFFSAFYNLYTLAVLVIAVLKIFYGDSQQSLWDYIIKAKFIMCK